MATHDVWQLDFAQVERIHQRLLGLDLRYHHALPDLAWLRSATEACFWASLEVEEGRGILGSVASAAPDDCVQRIRLANAVELGADRIRDLLPAVRPGGAALASIGPEIWGIALQLPHDAFFITIVGPGQLLFRCGERVISSLSGGALVDLPDLHEVLGNLFPRLAEYELRKVVIDASLLMRKIGHGGTIAFLEELGEGLAPNRLIDAGSRYRTWVEETFAEEELKNAPNDKEVQARTALEREYREQAKARLLRDIVQLTATDGLLALGEDLSVLCFGAKIESLTAPSQIELFDFASRAPRSVRIEELGGTRHQSAARLAWSRQDDVLVLVVSQDGRCSLLARVDAAEGPVLRVLRGFERAVPPDIMTLRFGSFATSSSADNARAK